MRRVRSSTSPRRERKGWGRSSVAAYRLRWGLHRTRVKASVGVVQLQPTLETVDAVLGAGALACTEAKAAGGDSVRVYVPAGTYEELAG